MPISVGIETNRTGVEPCRGLENIEAAFSALHDLGYRPTVPVTASQFADAKQREGWIRDKGMQVLLLWSDDHRETPVDIFVREPFPFDEEYRGALVTETAARPDRCPW